MVVFVVLVVVCLSVVLLVTLLDVGCLLLREDCGKAEEEREREVRKS